MSCRERVSGAYSRGALIRPFVADQLAHLEYLADAGQAMSNMDAVKLMKSAYLSNRIDQSDFAPALTEYVLVHRALVDQTPDNWGEFIISFVEQRLIVHVEANSARRKNQAFAATIENGDEEDEDGQAREFAAFQAFK